MAAAEDRPIVVSGGDKMYTITLPQGSQPAGGAFIVNALPDSGPFKTIEFSSGGRKLDHHYSVDLRRRLLLVV